MEQTTLHMFLALQMHCMGVWKNLPTQGSITQEVPRPMGIRTKDILAVKELYKPLDHQALKFTEQFDSFLLDT